MAAIDGQALLNLYYGTLTTVRFYRATAMRIAAGWIDHSDYVSLSAAIAAMHRDGGRRGPYEVIVHDASIGDRSLTHHEIDASIHALVAAGLWA